MKNVAIHFLESTQKLGRGQKSLISRAILKHACIAGEVLGLSRMDFTVYPNKDWCIPQTGDGGYTASPDWVQLYIDPSRQAKLKKIIKVSLPATIYHEMHHAKRMMTMGYGNKLLEVVITEGLASVFVEEMVPEFKAPWARYSDKEIQSYLKVFSEHLTDKKYNHTEWFFGEGKPYWLGYKVGIYIIRSLKQADSSFNCVDMADKKASGIFEKWKQIEA